MCYQLASIDLWLITTIRDWNYLILVDNKFGFFTFKGSITLGLALKGSLAIGLSFKGSFTLSSVDIV